MPAPYRPAGAPVETTRQPALDGLRGVAILLILAHHWLVWDWPAPLGSMVSRLQGFLGLSWAGVDLFFVLSGFLIGGILMDQRGSPNYFRTFWLRRFFRIAPVFVLFLSVYWLGSRVWPVFPPSSAPLAVHAAFLTNFWIAKGNFWDSSYLSLLWSLAIEEQVYLVLPFVVRFISPRLLAALAAAQLVVSPLLRVAIFLHRPSEVQLASHVLMPCRADAFAIGLLIALLVRRPALLETVRRGRALFTATGLILAIGLAWLTAFNPGYGTGIMCAAGYSVIIAAAGWLLLAASLPGPVAGFLSHPLLRMFGRWSYFLYLFHRLAAVLARNLVQGLDLGSFWQFAAVTLIATVIALTAAALSFRFFEQPLLAVGRRFVY